MRPDFRLINDTISVLSSRDRAMQDMFSQTQQLEEQAASVCAARKMEMAAVQLKEISVEELQRNAYKYTCLYLPAFFMTMAQATQMEDEYEVDTDIPMYVLTNKEKQFGAGAILYPGVLAQAEVLLGDSFYILPSSVHECILISAETTYNQKELAMMVEEINENHVDERDILSNRAYYYSKHSGRIEL